MDSLRRQSKKEEATFVLHDEALNYLLTTSMEWVWLYLSVHSTLGIILKGNQPRMGPRAKGTLKFQAMGEANEQERYLWCLKVNYMFDLSILQTMWTMCLNYCCDSKWFLFSIMRSLLGDMWVGLVETNTKERTKHRYEIPMAHKLDIEKTSCMKCVNRQSWLFFPCAWPALIAQNNCCWRQPFHVLVVFFYQTTEWLCWEEAN